MMEAVYELTSEACIIIATAELGWPELKIALLQQNELGYEQIFEKTGWRRHHHRPLAKRSWFSSAPTAWAGGMIPWAGNSWSISSAP